MFQLNKKWLFIIFGIIVIIVAFVTAYFIYQKNNENVVVGEINSERKKPSEEFALNIIGKYDFNDIKIDYINKEIGKNYYSYVKISGLNDKNIEDNINNNIKKIATSIDETSKNFDSSCYVNANYSNVISVYCNVTYYDKNDEFINSNNTYLNYNLATGEKLKFEDLFVDNAPIDTILSKSYYDYNIVYNKKIDAESNVRLLISEYNKGKLKFGFSGDSICYDFNKQEICFDMIDFKEYIAIYDRFKDSSNIYKEDFAYKNLLPLYSAMHAIPYYDREYSRYLIGYLNDYFYSEVLYSGKEYYIVDEEEKISNSDLKIYNKVYDEFIKLFNDKIDSMKKSSNGVFLSGYYDLYRYEDIENSYGTEYINKIFCVDYQLMSSVMSKNLFIDEYLPNRAEEYDEDVYNKLHKQIKDVDDNGTFYIIYVDDKIKKVDRLEDLSIEDIFSNPDFYRQSARSELEMFLEERDGQYDDDEITKIIDKGVFSYNFETHEIDFKSGDFEFTFY